jgi:hypothetical protein
MCRSWCRRWWIIWCRSLILNSWVSWYWSVGIEVGEEVEEKEVCAEVGV